MTDMRTAFAAEASELLDEDPLTAVVLAEISADLFAKAAARHPDRMLNVGIREQLMVSVAGGLALAGMRPIVHSYAPFLVERAFEQVKLDLAHQGGHAVLVSIGASYDAAQSGRTHQAPGDVTLVDSVPGFSVVVPGHPAEVRGLLREAVATLDAGSTYLRLSTESNLQARPVSASLQMVRSGRRAVVVAVGPVLDAVLEGVGDLDVTVAYTTTVRPFDADGLRSLEASSGAVVLVEPYLAVLEDSQLITRETDPFRKGRSLYRITEPLIVFYEAVMRREWTRLERGDTVGAWRNSQATFLAQVVGPHFEAICRDWALSWGEDVFGSVPGEVAAGVVADPLRRGQIQVDVAVFAPDDPGRPRRALSLGEAKWDKVMNLGHLERLRRARDLLAVKGYDTSATRLACYSGAGFDRELSDLAAADPVVQLIGLDRLYD